MTERRLSREKIIDQARQEVDQARGSLKQTFVELEATRARFGNLPFPLRVSLRGLTENGSRKRITRLTDIASQKEGEVFSREEWLTLLEESKDLNLQTFKTYYKWDSRGRTISIIRGRLDGTRIRVNRLHTITRDGEKDEHVGFEFGEERKMSQTEAERIFRRYHSLLLSRNEHEGIKRSVLNGVYPLDYWQEITQPRPTNRGKSRKRGSL